MVNIAGMMKDGAAKKLTLEETGRLFRLTRERIRQIFEKIKNNFKVEYFFDFNSIFETLSEIYIKNLYPLSFDNINETEVHVKKYNQNFYKRFVQDIIDPIPFYSYPNKIYKNKSDSAQIMVMKNELKTSDQIEARV